jgi:hypothetical protein
MDDQDLEYAKDANIVDEFRELLKKNIKDFAKGHEAITSKIDQIRENLSSSVVNPMY